MIVDVITLESHMPTIELETRISAPIGTVFDLSRCVDLHIESTAQTNERAVEGKTSGLLVLGNTVTWEATHFLVRQRLTIQITEYDRPNHFRDSMTCGIFDHFDHDHFFDEIESGTLVRDVFSYSSPLGMLGMAANILVVDRHMRKLLESRNEIIKSVAESSDADRYLRANTA